MPSIPSSEVWFDEQALKDMTRLQPLTGVKTIMITGGAGFIGSWVTRNLTMLYSNDYHIVCFDTLDVCSSLNNIRALNDCPNFSFVRGDICSAKDVRGCFSKFGVDAVIHFAALTHVDTSFDAGRDFAGTNFLGTLNLLEAARDFPIKRFVHMSTDEVYGEIPPGGEDHIETSPLIPTNPYSGSKAAAEMMVCAYAKSFRIPTVVVRCNNVYGPNQFPEKIIPKFLVLLLRGQKVPLYGHGRQTRRFIFGGDVANAINYIFHRGEVDGVYNIGTYDEISNRELTRHLVDLIEEKRLGHGRASGYELEDYIETVDDRPFHDRRYGVDFKRLKALGWTQKVRLDDGLRRTVDWYSKYGETWWGNVGDFITALETPSVASTRSSIFNGVSGNK